MLPCVPNALIRSVNDLIGDQQQDAMLPWLEEHGNRLQNVVITSWRRGCQEYKFVARGLPIVLSCCDKWCAGKSYY